MTSDQECGGEQVLEWAQFLFVFAVLILIGVAVGVEWPLKTVSAGFQCLGIVLTLLGLATIGDKLQQGAETAAQKAVIVRRRAAHWWTVGSERLRLWWVRLTGQTRPANFRAVSAGDSAAFAELATVKVGRARVDRATVTDREWLAFLDDRVEAILVRLDQNDQARNADRSDFQRRLGIQRDQLRREIVRETRNGWHLVFWGLLSSLIGTILGALA